MSFTSKNLQAVKPSATIAFSQMARDMIQEGEDVILLSQGEPDFDTPAHICTAANVAIQQGHTRYTNVDGTVELKEAICEKFLRDNDLRFEPDEINVSPGGKAVIFNALLATLDPGDEVIIPAPCWVSYPDMVRLCGGTPIVISCGIENGFKLTPDQLECAINDNTKWLILNSPSNPTGTQYSSRELAELGRVLLRHPQMMILTDDIYEKLSYQNSFHTLAQIVPQLKDRTLTMNGVSKAYAMTGWRIGYGGGPAWLIKDMKKVMSQSTSNPSSISMKAAVAALSGPQDFLDGWRTAFRRRRDMVVEAINKMPGLSCNSPDGAFYVFIDCEDHLKSTGQTDHQLALDLLQTEKVAVVPGSAFHAPGFLRLSFALDDKKLQKALNRFSDYFGKPPT